MARPREAPAANVTLRMPLTLIQDIDEMADRTGTSRAALIRQGVVKELQRLTAR